ncbi:hypothetical protein HDU79_008634 [Rhizoclosmatium sp. JEL0117]|nr:hypothetical protein HDU79_008634 [Rhizoclosmatium sp. JEL0117]
MDNSFRDTLVATTLLQVDALLKHNFITQSQHASIVSSLPVSPSSLNTHINNNAPAKVLPGAVPTPLRKNSAPLGGTSNTATHSIIQPNPSSVRVAVKAFQTGVEGDLSFAVGDLIEVLSEVDENWMSGSLNGKTGIFPTNFTEPKTLIKPSQIRHSTASPGPIMNSTLSKPPPTSPKPPSSISPPLPPPLSSKPMTKSSSSNSINSLGGGAGVTRNASVSGSMASLTPQPIPSTLFQHGQQREYFYLRSRANGNVLGVEMGLTSMVTHDSPIVVIPLTTKNTAEPLLLRIDDGCLVTPSNLAVDVRVGEWMNGGTVVLAKRVPPAVEERLHQRWDVSPDGVVKSERGFMLVEDYGRAVVWESGVDLDDQRWDLVPLSV